MSCEQYELQLKQLKEAGMVDAGVKKEFRGKVDRETYFCIPGLVTNTFGYYENTDGKWVVFITDGERGVEEKRHRCPSEEEAIRYVLELAESRNFCALCNSVLDGFAEKKPLLLAYLKKEHAYSEKKALKAIESLLRDKYIAFEFVYFVEHGEFVPDKYAVTVSGYTAKGLSEETVLTVLGAFNYMIYLKEKPEEAMADLQKGLPRRKLFTEADLKEMQT